MGVANKGGAILATHVEDCRLYSLITEDDTNSFGRASRRLVKLRARAE